MFVGSVQTVSRQDSQSKFQKFTLFSSCRIFSPTWRLHIRVLKFAQNISTNSEILGKRRDLKLREVFSLLIFLTRLQFLDLTHRIGFDLSYSFLTVTSPSQVAIKWVTIKSGSTVKLLTTKEFYRK